MTVKGGTSQACAACKYQRRRCTPDCVLAPYFPATKPEMFRNAHRLFGVRNIVRILEQLREEEKDEAMKSIIFESDMRERFPVHGCSWVIWQLKDQLRKSEEELFYVNSLLVKVRNKEEINTNFEIINPPQFQLGLVPSNNNNNVGFFESNDGMGKSSFLVQQQLQHGSMNNMNMNMNANANMNVNANADFFGAMKSSNHVVPFQHEIDICSNDYDDMHFGTIADDRQSYMESLEACESSVDSSLKDRMEYVDAMSQNHDLRSAAACFTLTSVN